MAKMVREGLTEKVETDRVVKFKFENMGKLPPPVLQFTDVTFGYSPDKVLYSHVDLGADLDSRVAVVSCFPCCLLVLRAVLMDCFNLRMNAQRDSLFVLQLSSIQCVVRKAELSCTLLS